MAFPEYVQQIAVCDTSWVEVYLQRLRMISHGAVIRIAGCSTGIPDTGSNDAVYDPKLGVGSPESPEAEAGSLENGRGGRIDRRNFYFYRCSIISGIHRLLLLV